MYKTTVYFVMLLILPTQKITWYFKKIYQDYF